MPNTFSGLAREVFANEFESNTGVTSFSQISGWFSANLGGLNNLIHTSFSGVDPELTVEAASIFKKQYMCRYYERAARNALRGITASSNAGDNILSISDGDNKIAFVNKNEVAKVYRGFVNDLTADIEKEAANYCLFMASPLSIGGIESSVSGVSFGGYYSTY